MALVPKLTNGYRFLTSGENYQPGDKLTEIPSNQIKSTPNRYTVQINSDQHIETPELSVLNHSCDPNVFIDTQDMCIYALKPIFKGDELTFFYPSTEWEMDKPFECQCGSENCLNQIQGAKFLSSLPPQKLNQHIISELNF